MKCLVESVACSVDDARAARRAGAGRIELCAAIELSGLTPSIGLVQEVLAACDLPVIAMVRPRSGDFVNSDSELATMGRDVEAFVEAGVHGLVFGVLDQAGRVSKEACRRLVEAAHGRETVFHRAFDVTCEPREALDDLMGLGFTRVLTSGQMAKAIEGAPLIRALRDRAAGRIQIMAGGGIRSENVRQVLESAGVDQVHLGPFERCRIGVGLYADGYKALDERQLFDTIRSVKETTI